MPETRYYQLAAHGRRPRDAADDAGVARRRAARPPIGAYDDERIVYRITPYRLDYYNYHRWSAPPGTIVGNYLEHALERSGQFRAVCASATDAPVVARRPRDRDRGGRQVQDAAGSAGSRSS